MAPPWSVANLGDNRNSRQTAPPASSPPFRCCRLIPSALPADQHPTSSAEIPEAPPLLTGAISVAAPLISTCCTPQIRTDRSSISGKTVGIAPSDAIANPEKTQHGAIQWSKTVPRLSIVRRKNSFGKTFSSQWRSALNGRHSVRVDSEFATYHKTCGSWLASDEAAQAKHIMISNQKPSEQPKTPPSSHRRSQRPPRPIQQRPRAPTIRATSPKWSDLSAVRHSPSNAPCVRRSARSVRVKTTNIRQPKTYRQ